LLIKNFNFVKKKFLKNFPKFWKKKKNFPQFFFPQKKKKKQRQNLPPQIKTFVTLYVFTTNKELFGLVIKFTSNK